jgi:hypothetical protein
MILLDVYACFLYVATPLHSITTNRNIFQWGKSQNKAFEDMKQKIYSTLVLTLPICYSTSVLSSQYSHFQVKNEGKPIHVNGDVPKSVQRDSKKNEHNCIT